MTMAKEYIEREALKERFNSHLPIGESIRGIIDDIPAADVVEVKRGKWTFEHDPITDPKGYFIRIVCSCCGLKTGQVSNYCPNCGAKMDGERKE